LYYLTCKSLFLLTLSIPLLSLFFSPWLLAMMVAIERCFVS
jgi:hypothetical protein